MLKNRIPNVYRKLVRKGTQIVKGSQTLGRITLDATLPFGPAQANQNNLLFVLRACREGEIDPIYIEKESHSTSAVFLHESDRAGFMNSLSSLWDEAVGAELAVSGAAPVRIRAANVLRSYLGEPVSTISVCKFYRVRKASAAFNWRHATRVTFYRENDGWLEAIPGERMTPRVYGKTTEAAERLAFASERAIDRIKFDIDVVYTWVDGSDPEWAARRAEAERLHGVNNISTQANSRARFENRDELRYSIRSLIQNAPWVRNIYVVTDTQVPRWLKSNPRCNIIDHRDIFPEGSALPTFNSHAIESVIHRIPGLAEHFLYFNDDVFLARPTMPETFFDPNGILKVFVTQSRIPLGPPRDLRNTAEYAGNNTARLILDDFGLVVRKRPKHAPYAMTKSLMFELEQVYAELFKDVRLSQFRSVDDISVATYLFPNYALASRNAVFGDIDYQYINISNASVKSMVETFERYFTKPAPNTFCLNDVADDSYRHWKKQHQLVLKFMNDLFPIKSPFEK